MIHQQSEQSKQWNNWPKNCGISILRGKTKVAVVGKSTKPNFSLVSSWQKWDNYQTADYSEFSSHSPWNTDYSIVLLLIFRLLLYIKKKQICIYTYPLHFYFLQNSIFFFLQNPKWKHDIWLIVLTLESCKFLYNEKNIKINSKRAGKKSQNNP